jgi:aminopeptidase N
MNELTAASGKDMSDFFNDWVNSPGYPHFSIDSTVSVPVGGGNYNVTVYIKQKLTGAPHYYNNVPLEITFMSGAWMKQTKEFVMSGANGSASFNLPFDPAYTAVNLGEKISHAVAPEFKTIRTTGNHNFVNAKMSLNVLNVVDSSFVRVEHNYTAPDPFKAFFVPYRLSPNHYWKVDGIFSQGFRAKATISYDGRTTSFSGNLWLDNLLNITTEDSLFLMYRRSAADDWAVYPYYTKTAGTSVTDKRGFMTIDSLQKGEYVWAVRDYLITGIQPSEGRVFNSINVFPNPAKNLVTVDLTSVREDIYDASVLVITDVSGKMVASERLNDRQEKVLINTANYSNGIYFVNLRTSDSRMARSKFIVSH